MALLSWPGVLIMTNAVPGLEAAVVGVVGFYLGAMLVLAAYERFRLRAWVRAKIRRIR